jgi:hypothetical protein
MENNPLTYAEKQDEVILREMIISFDKSYGRYFIDSAERWRKTDEKKEEENKARMEEEAMVREDTEIIRLENLEKKKQDDIHTKFTEEHYPLPSWKITNKKNDFRIKPNYDFTTKNIIQDIPLKKGGIITLNDFEKVVTSNDVIDDGITYEEPNYQNYSEMIPSFNKLPK